MVAPARIPHADYNAIPAVRWSNLKEMRRSPLAYKWSVEHGRTDSDAMALGRVTHLAVFEPDRLPLEVAVWRGGRRYGKDWTAFQEAHADQTIVTASDYGRACAIRDAVRNHPVAAPLLRSGEPEQTIEWTDERTGIRCKARLDWIGESSIVDLKTTSKGINPIAFGKTCANSQYIGQVEFYREGLLAARGLELGAVLIAVESLPPHDVAVYRLTEDELYAAEEEIRELMDRLVECQTTGHWPGAYTTEQALKLPRWFYGDEEDLDGDGAGVKWLMGDEQQEG